MQFTLNGRPVDVRPRPEASLLEVLREDCGLRSMKDGCAPEGSCGACTVIVDGRAVVSCAQPAARVAGRSVVTLEGLAARIARRPGRTRSRERGAAQCGFCTPGIVMKAEALLGREAEPTRDEIARALAGNLCRCTGYVKVLDAIEAVAGRGDAATDPPPERHGDGVGERVGRYDGPRSRSASTPSSPT